MADIRSIRAEIRARLIEVQKLIEPLVAEAEQLERLVATLADDIGAGAASPERPAPPGAAPKPTRRPRARPAPKAARPPGRSRRAEQAVAKIREQPGITPSELADAIGVSTNYLYRVLPRLERDQLVTKRGRGYHPTGNAGPTAATNGQPDKS